MAQAEEVGECIGDQDCWTAAECRLGWCRRCRGEGVGGEFVQIQAERVASA